MAENLAAEFEVALFKATVCAKTELGSCSMSTLPKHHGSKPPRAHSHEHNRVATMDLNNAFTGIATEAFVLETHGTDCCDCLLTEKVVVC